MIFTAKQQEADVKRLKLSYVELGTCDEEANDTWDLIMSQAQSNPTQKCDIQLLNSAILRGEYIIYYVSKYLILNVMFLVCYDV